MISIFPLNSYINVQSCVIEVSQEIKFVLSREFYAANFVIQDDKDRDYSDICITATVHG